jgi:hypothetical protein
MEPRATIGSEIEAVDDRPIEGIVTILELMRSS